MRKFGDRAEGFEAGQEAKERPDFITDEHLEFLDRLRKSGRTNMFGAGPYLRKKFPNLTDADASTVLGYWMQTFSERHQGKE